MSSVTSIPHDSRPRVARELSRVLADTYTLMLKSHGFHWNVTGPQFNSLHTMFETQYTELALAVDELAERIRSLGEYAPGSYKQFADLSSINEETTVPDAEEMVKQLVAGHEAVVKTARAVYPSAEAGNDEATADLLTQRIALHEKTAWMLRSLIA